MIFTKSNSSVNLRWGFYKPTLSLIPKLRFGLFNLPAVNESFRVHFFYLPHAGGSPTAYQGEKSQPWAGEVGVNIKKES